MFEIAHGELVSLLGPSGCGKTTTLRCIAGLETPEEGRIEIDDEIVFGSARGIMVEPYHRSIGMVFQCYAIWPHLSVFHNVAFLLHVRRRPRTEVECRVMVRPDQLDIEPDTGNGVAANRLRGTVVQRLFLGGHFEYAVAVGPTLLRVFSPVQIEEAARVVVSFAPQDGIILGAEHMPMEEEPRSWA